jgi:hypothetical protein
MTLKDDWAPYDTIPSAMANAHAAALNDLLARVAALEGGGGGGGGAVLAYAERTTSMPVTATIEASANTVVTAPAFTAAGSAPVWVEVFVPGLTTGATSGAALVFTLWEGSTNLGWIGAYTTPAAAALGATFYGARILTPASGSRTYSLRAFRFGSDGFLSIQGGGSGNYMPAFIRVSET